VKEARVAGFRRTWTSIVQAVRHCGRRPSNSVIWHTSHPGSGVYSWYDGRPPPSTRSARRVRYPPPPASRAGFPTGGSHDAPRAASPVPSRRPIRFSRPLADVRPWDDAYRRRKPVLRVFDGRGRPSYRPSGTPDDALRTPRDLSDTHQLNYRPYRPSGTTELSPAFSAVCERARIASS
jgi:hypothetical protein